MFSFAKGKATSRPTLTIRMATAEEQAAEALHSITLNSIHTYPGRFE
jgi:hypothetical protein